MNTQLSEALTKQCWGRKVQQHLNVLWRPHCFSLETIMDLTKTCLDKKVGTAHVTPAPSQHYEPYLLHFYTPKWDMRRKRKPQKQGWFVTTVHSPVKYSVNIINVCPHAMCDAAISFLCLFVAYSVSLPHSTGRMYSASLYHATNTGLPTADEDMRKGMRVQT